MNSYTLEDFRIELEALLNKAAQTNDVDDIGQLAREIIAVAWYDSDTVVSQKLD